ncbi:TonB-dependent receptor domain-containing protein [Dyadobacter subterraneus]|uniref:TonB-dependent receptor n=1 Tax=Dyadobacter subterraneus TaxID=2773304 RepID=A0ABR9WCW4_9BACT|nr:outer membrane beta-barrel family protein [Dyadobacter subterraneus]MBE9463327.1 TonB-dependent receptor [Dyadobacter subterraneus]
MHFINKPFILLNLSCYLLLSFSGFSQQTSTGTVKGKLLDTSQKPIEFATVALYKTIDSTIVKGTITDSSGLFLFEKTAEGNYYVQATFLGYKTFTSKTFSINKAKHEIILENTVLDADDKTLQAVVITAKKPLVEQQIDRTVLNLENSILSEGNTALELLEKAPGITVDDEGNISMKGKPGVSVMLNGKLTYLSQKELTTLLRGTSSGSVSKIELITNPSAKYDAAGNSGIINIVLKKNEKVGINGNVYVNGARSRANRYGGGASLNYRSGKFNVYGSYDHAFRGEIEYLSFTRRFYDGNVGGKPDRISYQNSATNEPLHTNNYKLGADIFLDAKNTFGVLVNGNFGTYANDNNTTNLLVSATGETLSNPLTHNDNLDRWNSNAYNVNYTHKLNQSGRELSVDLDYSQNDNRSNQNMDTRYLSAENSNVEARSVRRGYVPSLTNVYVGKIDYTHPFGEKAKLEMGWKSSNVSVDNNLKYDTLRNEQWIPDPSWSNHFTYKETIHAGYINFSKQFGSVSVQAGLRGENTQTTGHQVTTDSLVKRQYFQLFPSLFVSKTFNTNHTGQFSYSRRIQRPDYDDMNPFRFFRDPFLYYEGNPFLKPELTHSVELSHTFKGIFITVINYSYTSDVMNWMMGQVDSLNTTYQSPQNLKSFINYGISFTASLQPASWWTSNSFANFFRNDYKGDQKGGNLNNGIWSFSVNSQNTFQLGRGFSAELSGFYNSKSVYGVFVSKGFYVISAGAQKQVLDKKGTIKLMVNDIFQTRQRRNTAKYENLDMDGHIRFDSRMATISFSYRFGKDITPVRKRNSGSEDIQNRVKGGN